MSCWCCVRPCSPAWSLAEDNPVTIAEQQLRDIKQELEQGVTSGDRYDAMMQDIDRIQRQAQACIDDTGRQVQKLAGDLESLGAEAAGEDVTVTRARRDLGRNKNAVEKKLAVCRLLRVNADRTRRHDRGAAEADIHNSRSRPGNGTLLPI